MKLIKKIYKKTTETEMAVTSCLIFFKHPYQQKYIVDQACLLLGNIPPNYHAFYTNFTNWTLDEQDKLIYTGVLFDPSRNINTNINVINPYEVYIHLKISTTAETIDSISTNPIYWNYYFNSSLNKTYQLIVESLKSDQVKIIDCTNLYGPIHERSIKTRVKQIRDPRFYTDQYQIYGTEMNQIMYAGLIPESL